MAAIDDLLARIDDPALRADLERELAPLRGDQELGLVFEKHLPEKVRLPGLPVRVGATVEVRPELDSPTWRVTKIEKTSAELVRNEVNGDPVVQTCKVKDLIVVGEFGDPIYPGLQSLGRIERGGDRPFHAVINSENYHALETLTYTCAGQVDCIYIDPPFNTGDRSWKYNNDYVDNGDQYRHSKWLSFMEKRLSLAKELLRPNDGVLIVAIDEHEVSRLDILLQQMFPSHIHAMVTIVTNPKGTIRGQFGRVDEHALFVIPDNGQNLIAGKIIDSSELEDDDADDDDDVGSEVDLTDVVPGDSVEEEEEESSNEDFEFQLFRRRGSASLRDDRPNRFYPIYINEDQRTIEAVGDTLPLGKKPSFRRKNGLRPIWPIDSDGNDRVWRWKVARVQQILEKPDEQGRYLTLGRYNPAIDNWTINLAVPRKTTVKQKTVWWEKRYDAGTHGTTLLQKFLGRSRQFDYPKSLYLVRDMLDLVVRDRPNALVLDFFAGSGTTTHALALLNKDGGRRRSILVTNNEVASKLAEQLVEEGKLPGQSEYESHGIFRNVTKPRLEAALTGTRADKSAVPGRYLERTPFSEGLEENLEFFGLTYEDPDRVQLGTAFAAVAPLLWLMAGACGPRIDELNGAWAVPNDGCYGILFDVNEWPAYCDAIRNAKDITHAFVVTDSEAVFQRVVAELPDGVQPVHLYESYLTSFMLKRALT